MVSEQFDKAFRTLRWLPAYAGQRLTRRTPARPSLHLLVALADHFEPGIQPENPAEYAPLAEQRRRLAEWCELYPKIFTNWRDSDGRPFRHTYFYPAEQYDESLLDMLSEHCRDGWGETEIHLHHGVARPDTAENTRAVLVGFRDALVRHGCLSYWDGDPTPRYAFVHGNWALANSAGGRCCGVDEEMAILSETGCYADMTLPSFPNRAQVPKINALYECGLPLRERAPHRRGRDLRCGTQPRVYPLIMQGPLGLNFARRVKGLPVPYIENGALTTPYPPTMYRFDLWRKAAITVKGRPDWLFIKLHCHGMDPRDRGAMLGEQIQNFLRELTDGARNGGFKLHFVTAREMVNVALAACDGREGDPNDYRDFRLRLITSAPGARPAATADAHA